MLSKSISAAVLLALFSAPAVYPAPNTLTGSIVGIVSDALGIPQMGAVVLLFNRMDRMVSRTLTDDRGSFQFDSIPSDVYSVKVTLNTFMPALRNGISIQPGVRRVLSINLAGMLSTIDLVYSLPVKDGFMSEDWKWTLRGSLATRPILRFAPIDSKDPHSVLLSGFTNTRGTVRLSAGDSALPPTLGSQPDLGTAFALATSYRGHNNFEVAGNLGYASSSGIPAASFRTSFSRQFGDYRSPEVSVTMRQILLPGRMPGAAGPDSAPMFRTMSFSLSDQVQLSDHFSLSYGATLESVSFLQRLNYLSPYALASADLEGWGVVEFGYNSGLPPTALYARDVQSQEFQQLSNLGMFPRVSVHDGAARVQHARNYELGYHKKLGSRTFGLSAYSEKVSNAALTATGAEGVLAAGDLLPDLFSSTSVLNAGAYSTTGYMVSIKQSFGENVTMTVAYGNSGVLEAGRENLGSNDVAELRDVLRTQRRHWASTQMAAVLPHSGTRFTTGYQFMNGRSLTPGHFYMTQGMNPAQGLNLQIRQPIPVLGGTSGKLEATAEIRNMLAQGYQPIYLPSGQSLRLVHSPRALRGGLAFIF
ncbi:MAG: carboxypeptidase regulatory-like domain-containing protein [Acidobacteria bacterium]|nr:carboxypeptidase regulatory-like domain-containing protein [Acidobacteriota bacterium]